MLLCLVEGYRGVIISWYKDTRGSLLVNIELTEERDVLVSLPRRISVLVTNAAFFVLLFVGICLEGNDPSPIRDIPHLT